MVSAWQIETVFATNRPSSTVSGHVTGDLYTSLYSADVGRVHTVRMFTGVEDLSTVARLATAFLNVAYKHITSCKGKRITVLI